MQTGVFVDQPSHFNPKCVYFAAVLMFFYWYLPNRNPFLLPVIFVVAYIAMAWYDYLYNCDMQLYSGKGLGMTTLDSWGKPQRRTKKPMMPDSGTKLVDDQEYQYRVNIHRFHVVAVASVLIYVGYAKDKSTKYIWNLIGAYGILVTIYHAFRFFYPREVSHCPDTEETQNEVNYNKGINLLHLIGIAPELFYVAYAQDKSDPRIWDAFLAIGIVTLVYHLYRVFKPRPSVDCEKNNVL